MKNLIVCLILLFAAYPAPAQDDYYRRKAESYTREAEYWQKKADGYRREAEYRLAKAEGHQRNAAYYTRKGDLDLGNAQNEAERPLGKSALGGEGGKARTMLLGKI